VTAFEVEVRCDGGTTVVALRGELDIAGGPTLVAAVDPLADGPRSTPVELDCTELAFLDPSGLAALVRAGRRLDRGPLRLRSVRPNVLLVLEVAGIRHAFAVVDEEGRPLPW
jgi:anti-sigma B factor antagonist